MSKIIVNLRNNQPEINAGRKKVVIKHSNSSASQPQQGAQINYALAEPFAGFNLNDVAMGIMPERMQRHYNNQIKKSAEANWEYNEDTTPEAIKERQDRYAQNQSELAEIERKLNILNLLGGNESGAKGVLKDFASGYASKESEDVSPNKANELKKRKASLEAENRRYENLLKRIDDYYNITLADDFKTVSAKRDGDLIPSAEYIKSRKSTSEIVTDYNGDQYDSAGNKLYDAKTKKYTDYYYDVYTSPLVKDPLGTYLKIKGLSPEEIDTIRKSPNHGYHDMLMEGEGQFYDHLNDEDISKYYYILNTNGTEAARKYLKDILPVLEYRAGQARAEYLKNASNLELAGLNLLTTPAQILSGITDPILTAESAMEGDNYLMGAYGGYGLGNFVKAVRGETSNRANELTNNEKLLGMTLGDAYQAGMSGVDSLVGAMAFKQAYPVIMGMGAASSTAQELWERGASSEQIAVESLLAGAAEMVFEAVSVEIFLKNFLEQPVKGVAKNIAKILVQGGVEASEETLTEISNILADRIVMQSESDWEQAIKKYMDDGYNKSEALNLAYKEMGERVWKAAASGFISGGGMGAGGAVANQAKYANHVNKVDKFLKRIAPEASKADIKRIRKEILGEIPAARNIVSANSEEGRAVIDKVTSSFGLSVRYENLDKYITINGVEKFDSPNGYFDESTNTIVINSSDAVPHNPLAFVFKHEFTHSASIAGENFNKFIGNVITSDMFENYVKSKGKTDAEGNFNNFEKVDDYIANLIERYEQSGKSLGSDPKSAEKAAKEEAVANFVGDVLFGGNTALTENLLNAMDAETKKGFIAWVKRFFQRLKDALRGTKHLSEIEALEKQFLSVAKEASEVRTEKAAKAEKAPQEKTTTKEGSGDVSWSYTYVNSETSSISEQIEKNKERLNQMSVVGEATVPENLKTKYEAAEWAISQLKSTGYQVDRQNFGKIFFDEKDIRKGAEYADTNAEKAAFVLIPKVLKRGIEIGHHGNHKMRQKETITFAAPVILNGIRGNMAVVVNMRGNKYLVHRIVLPDGSTFKFSDKNKEAKQESYQGGTENSSLADTTSLTSKLSIPNSPESVKKKFSLPETDREYMSAVENGDMETAQRLVDEAAEDAGYDIKGYHGTNAEFSVINNNTEYGLPFFITTDKQSAQTFGDREMSLYARKGKVLDLDAKKEHVHFARYSYKNRNVGFTELLRLAKRDGYDSVTIRNTYDSSNGSGELSTVFAMFYPEKQVKSADPVTYDDDGNVIPLSQRFNAENPDMRYSIPDYAPTFYSQMGKVVDDMKQSKIGAESVIPYLTGRGVKSEEIKWSGIEEFLRGKKSVTKEELQEFIAGSQLQIEEEVLTGKEIETTPVRKGYDIVSDGEVIDTLVYDRKSGWYTSKTTDRSFRSKERAAEYYSAEYGDTKWRDYALEGGSNYREILFRLPNSSYTNKAMGVHWGEDRKGVLAHARIQDFTTPDGKKMLFIEEIQSDWHNERHKQEKALSKGEIDKTSVPEAPFSENYHEFVLKSLIRMAAEEGYDAIGWTPAGIQSTRFSEDYSESYHIEYDQNIPRFLRRYGKKWGATVGEASVSPQRFPVAVQQVTNAFDEIITDIEASIKPSVLKATIKWQGKKVTVSEALAELRENGLSDDSGDVEEITFAARSVLHKFANRLDDARKYAASDLVREKATNLKFDTAVWSMDITDSMKDSVLYEGQPRYSLPELDRAKEDLDSGKITLEEYRDIVNSEFEAQTKAMGALPEGEMATPKNKTAPTPSKSIDGKKVSLFARTYLESGLMTEEMEAYFKDSVLRGDMSYTPVSDDTRINKATASIGKEGYAHAKESWKKTVESDWVSPADLVVKGEALLALAGQEQDVPGFLDIATDLAELSTRTGQALQAFSVLKRLGGIGKLVYLQKAVNKINQDLEKRGGKKEAPKVKISDKLADALAKASTEGEAEAIAGKIMQEVADQVPVTFLDKWNAWRYMSMLFNPTTHVRNVVGNAVFLPMARAKDVLALVGEQAIKKENRTKALIVKPEYREFAEKDFVIMEPTITGTGKYNPANEILDKRAIFKTKVLETARELNFNALEAEDKMFLEKHYVHALGSFLQARGINPSEATEQQLTAARDYAIKEAQKATYRDASRMASFISKLSKQGTVANLLVEGVLPFKKTPINILKRGVEYSPIGFLTTGAKAIKGLVKGEFSVSEMIDGFASATAGSVVPFVMGLWLASLGIAKGGFDDEDELEARLTGAQEYSVEIGGKSYTVDWAAPSVIPFFMGVALVENESDPDKDWLENLLSLGANGLEPLLNLSMLSGINDLINSVSYSEENQTIWQVGATAIESYFSQALPTILGKTANLADSTRRTRYIDKTTDVPKALQKAWDNVLKKVPFASRTRAEYIDAWGEMKYTGNFISRFFQQYVSPGYASTVSESDITEELKRLYSQTKENSIYPKTPSKYITIGGVRRDWSKEEYYEIATFRGHLQADLVDEAIHSEIYKALTDEQKAKLLNELYEYANNVAKSRMDYSFEEISAKLNGNGKTVITQEKYDRLTDEAKGILIREMFLTGKMETAYGLEQKGGSAVEYLARKIATEK